VDLVLTNIKQLVTVGAATERQKRGPAMRELGVLSDAAVVCRAGKIAWVGRMKDLKPQGDLPEYNAAGMVVLPGFVDSHTHMMFAGDRSGEFALRAEGATYQQIAASGGGIVSTVGHVRQASKKDLKRSTSRYLGDMLRHGTTTVEIKSGYGLETRTELRMLEAIGELAREEVATVVATFIGAHAVPPEFAGRQAEYVDLVVAEMLPLVAERRLASFCDVFCDQGYFTVGESRRILTEALRLGFGAKLHAEELGPGQGAALAAELGAVSCDHLEHIDERGIAALAASEVVAALLPGVSFYLDHGYAPARSMIDRGVAVAIASDFNPGSCMAFSMPLMMTIACTHMRMTPEEAITASTFNGAAALGCSSTYGSIEVGKMADMIVCDIPHYRHLAYHCGTNHVVRTIKQGTLLEC
jgi:imidazolonepropionase